MNILLLTESQENFVNKKDNKFRVIAYEDISSMVKLKKKDSNPGSHFLPNSIILCYVWGSLEWTVF